MSRVIEQHVDEYDEFASLGDLRAAFDAEIPSLSKLPVRRTLVEVLGGTSISMLNWGTGEEPIIFLHGGGQNAHTWDSLAVLLGRNAIAIDLPGHGHSSWRDDHDYSPVTNSAAISTVIREAAPDAPAVIGMSLGGLTATVLAARYPELVRALVLVDVTPGVSSRVATMTPEERGATILVHQQRVFSSFEEMVTAAARAIPTRPRASLHAGVRHNSKQLDNGDWAWRYDLGLGRPHGGVWDDLAKITAPIMLVKGGSSGFVGEEDLAEVFRLQPNTRLEIVSGAGHAVQSDRPSELAGLIQDFLGYTTASDDRSA
jgi:pimeloyl-ACP methyl ester carboxylesterase